MKLLSQVVGFSFFALLTILLAPIILFEYLFPDAEWRKELDTNR